MNTGELIKKLQEADPTGKLPVVALAEDGYAYDLGSVEEQGCDAGVVDDEGKGVIVIDASN
jgi:hypothetical protein